MRAVPRLFDLLHAGHHERRPHVRSMPVPLRFRGGASSNCRGTSTAEPRRPSVAPVSMHELSRTFNDLVAVDAVSLDVSAGSILGIIGPSGSGKTTLVRMMTGTLEPTSGSVHVLGENPRRFRRQTRERLGYMSQLVVLYPELTAAENVSFVGSLFGLLWPRRRRRVREVLDLVEFWDFRNRRPGRRRYADQMSALRANRQW